VNYLDKPSVDRHFVYAKLLAMKVVYSEEAKVVLLCGTEKLRSERYENLNPDVKIQRLELPKDSLFLLIIPLHKGMSLFVCVGPAIHVFGALDWALLVE